MTQRRARRFCEPRLSTWPGHGPIGSPSASGDPQPLRSRTCLFLLCLFLIGSGCAIAPRLRQPDVRVHAGSDVSATFEQMRLRMRMLVQPMSGVLVASADQILADTTDRAIRREALRWKIEAVPALREALFRPDPVTAIADSWVLTFQMTDYFEQGAGAANLGAASAIAVTTSQRLEAEIARVAASLTTSGDVSRARDYARKWAADHPMRQSIAGREPALRLVTDQEWANSFSTKEAVGNLLVTVDDLNRRLEIYSAQLLDQARWQVELFVMDFTRDHRLENAVPLAEQAVRIAGQAADNVARLVPAIERSISGLEKTLPLAASTVTAADQAVEALVRTLPAVGRALAVIEQTPALVAAERTAALQDLSAELRHTLAFIQDERLATLKQLTTERIAAVRDLADAVVEQRKGLTQDIDGIAAKAVDRAFLRAAQLGAAVLGAGFFGIILLMLIARRVFFGPWHAGGQPGPRGVAGPA